MENSSINPLIYKENSYPDDILKETSPEDEINAEDLQHKTALKLIKEIADNMELPTETYETQTSETHGTNLDNEISEFSLLDTNQIINIDDEAKKRIDESNSIELTSLDPNSDIPSEISYDESSLPIPMQISDDQSEEIEQTEYSENIPSMLGLSSSQKKGTNLVEYIETPEIYKPSPTLTPMSPIGIVPHELPKSQNNEDQNFLSRAQDQVERVLPTDNLENDYLQKSPSSFESVEPVPLQTPEVVVKPIPRSVTRKPIIRSKGLVRDLVEKFEKKELLPVQQKLTYVPKRKMIKKRKDGLKSLESEFEPGIDISQVKPIDDLIEIFEVESPNIVSSTLKYDLHNRSDTSIQNQKQELTQQYIETDPEKLYSVDSLTKKEENYNLKSPLSIKSPVQQQYQSQEFSNQALDTQETLTREGSFSENSTLDEIADKQYMNDEGMNIDSTLFISKNLKSIKRVAGGLQWASRLGKFICSLKHVFHCHKIVDYGLFYLFYSPKRSDFYVFLDNNTDESVIDEILALSAKEIEHFNSIVRNTISKYSKGSNLIVQQYPLEKDYFDVSSDSNGDSLSFLDILKKSPSQSSEYAINSSHNQKRQELTNKNSHLTSNVDITQVRNENEEFSAELSNLENKFSLKSSSNKPLTYKAALSLEDQIKKKKEKRMNSNNFGVLSKKGIFKSQVNKNLHKQTETHRNILNGLLSLETTPNLQEQARKHIETTGSSLSSGSISTLPELNIKKGDLKPQVNKGISGKELEESLKKDLHTTGSIFTHRDSLSSGSISTLPELNIKKGDLKPQIKGILGKELEESLKKDLHTTGGIFTRRHSPPSKGISILSKLRKKKEDLQSQVNKDISGTESEELLEKDLYMRMNNLKFSNSRKLPTSKSSKPRQLDPYKKRQDKSTLDIDKQSSTSQKNSDLNIEDSALYNLFQKIKDENSKQSFEHVKDTKTGFDLRENNKNKKSISRSDTGIPWDFSGINKRKRYSSLEPLLDDGYIFPKQYPTKKQSPVQSSKEARQLREQLMLIESTRGLYDQAVESGDKSKIPDQTKKLQKLITEKDLLLKELEEMKEMLKKIELDKTQNNSAIPDEKSTVESGSKDDQDKEKQKEEKQEDEDTKLEFDDFLGSIQLDSDALVFGETNKADIGLSSVVLDPENNPITHIDIQDNFGLQPVGHYTHDSDGIAPISVTVNSNNLDGLQPVEGVLLGGALLEDRSENLPNELELSFDEVYLAHHPSILYTDQKNYIQPKSVIKKEFQRVKSPVKKKTSYSKLTISDQKIERLKRNPFKTPQQKAHILGILKTQKDIEERRKEDNSLDTSTSMEISDELSNINSSDNQSKPEMGTRNIEMNKDIYLGDFEEASTDDSSPANEFEVSELSGVTKEVPLGEFVVIRNSGQKKGLRESSHSISKKYVPDSSKMTISRTSG
ncbi:uncharacterized protein CMU_028270 [Cryptosporidium muris RN66]|uniref:Uncharacterized protein n=1 Tax=Cryptosporidium muris (strain RN66) TaxID=441375 RepID=B6AK57_CRYMR|nr:uncharacterized protein CMU_028270 [Cryptosporidium muris RN66]EEA08598.1 hypothetical protein CMU_028270 [Cryptosporidium muris RN66]|eukprot:XP_002142947.1 hypothetical protein [Cryptosporidium muris RN66]